ncbi:MAG: HAMP domain-containing protein [Alphaproteobacteria bacterium]|nr:HAMP domain-containing protein [Alphaproteobacteria bacterium]
MSLRRWLLGSLLLGLLLVLAAAGLSSRWAWRQASRELVGARVEQVLEAARRMEAGASMEDCEAQLAIDLRFEEGPPEGPPHPPGMRGPPPGDHGWKKVEGRGRPLWIHDPPGEVAAYVDGRWILLHEDLVGPAVLRVLGVLLLVLGPLVGGASWFVDRSLRPVAAAQDAMGRIAQGDLGHRLDEAHGPAELRAVARHFNAMADVVEARLRLERQLMAGLSHELRTRSPGSAWRSSWRGSRAATPRVWSAWTSRWSGWTSSSPSCWSSRGSRWATWPWSARTPIWPRSRAPWRRAGPPWTCGGGPRLRGPSPDRSCAGEPPLELRAARAGHRGRGDGHPVLVHGGGRGRSDARGGRRAPVRAVLAGSGAQGAGHGVGLGIVRQVAVLHGGAPSPRWVTAASASRSRGREPVGRPSVRRTRSGWRRHRRCCWGPRIRTRTPPSATRS